MPETTILVSTTRSAMTVDRITNALETISVAHHEVHEGESFVYSGQKTLASGGTMRILFTPNSTSYPHLLILARSSAETNYKLWEGGTFSGGTAITAVYDRNRYTKNTKASTLKTNPTITDTGTLIYESHFGSGNNTGGEDRGVHEWIFNTSTNYLVDITSEANSNDVSWALDWYEESDI